MTPTPLHRTLARHRIVLRELEGNPDHCKETARLYKEEIDALEVALAVEAITQADGATFTVSQEYCQTHHIGQGGDNLSVATTEYCDQLRAKLDELRRLPRYHVYADTSDVHGIHICAEGCVDGEYVASAALDAILEE